MLASKLTIAQSHLPQNLNPNFKNNFSFAGDIQPPGKETSTENLQLKHKIIMAKKPVQRSLNFNIKLL